MHAWRGIGVAGSERETASDGVPPGLVSDGAGFISPMVHENDVFTVLPMPSLLLEGLRRRWIPVRVGGNPAMSFRAIVR